MTDRTTAPPPEWRHARLFREPDMPPADDDHDEDDQ